MIMMMIVTIMMIIIVNILCLYNVQAYMIIGYNHSVALDSNYNDFTTITEHDEYDKIKKKYDHRQLSSQHVKDKIFKAMCIKFRSELESRSHDDIIAYCNNHTKPFNNLEQHKKDFEWSFYIKYNTDLVTAGINNEALATTHYKEHGELICSAISSTTTTFFIVRIITIFINIINIINILNVKVRRKVAGEILRSVLRGRDASVTNK